MKMQFQKCNSSIYHVYQDNLNGYSPLNSGWLTISSCTSILHVMKEESEANKNEEPLEWDYRSIIANCVCSVFLRQAKQRGTMNFIQCIILIRNMCNNVGTDKHLNILENVANTDYQLCCTKTVYKVLFKTELPH